MIMHDFEYVPKEEWKPIRDELFEIIHRLQNEVRDDFTFQYHFVGSSKRDMITRDRKSNKGFDFDVNIEVNDPDEDYSAKKYEKFFIKVSIKSLIPMDIRFSDMITPKIPPVFSPSK